MLSKNRTLKGSSFLLFPHANAFTCINNAPVTSMFKMLNVTYLYKFPTPLNLCLFLKGPYSALVFCLKIDFIYNEKHVLPLKCYHKIFRQFLS